MDIEGNPVLVARTQRGPWRDGGAAQVAAEGISSDSFVISVPAVPRPHPHPQWMPT